MARASKYTPEIEAYIRAHIGAMPAHEMCDELQRLFGLEVSDSSIYNFCKRKGIRGYTTKLSAEQTEWLRQNAPGVPRKEMWQRLCAEYNLNITYNQYLSFVKNHKIKCGRDTRFVKGQPSLTKGMKFDGYKRSSTCFQKGCMPHNYHPVGTELLRENVLWVKIADPNIWKQKHRIVWEQAHGPVARRAVIKHLDGNPLNCELSNLKLIGNNVHFEMNRTGLGKVHSELTAAAIATAELNVLRREKQNEKTKHDRKID